MSFTTPTALLLLLLIPLFIWIGRPQATTPIRRHWREWANLGVRLMLTLLIILGLAGAQMVRAADDLAVVFLIDGSDSIQPQQARQAEELVRAAISAMAPQDQAAVVLFGANALVDRPMSSLAELASIQSVPQSLHTNLAAAIRLGMALFPAGSARRMIILSDGLPTTGDTAVAAQLAAANNVPLDFIYLSRPADGAEVTLLDVDAPAQVSAGESFGLTVTAASNVDTPAELRVLAGGNIVHQETVQLRTGTNNFAVRLRAAAPEFARYQIQLSPAQDTYFQNNELAAFTEITGAPRILLVAPDGTPDNDGALLPDESPQLQLALQATGLEVERATPAELPASLATLSNYASVVLVNVNAKNLTPRKMEALESYVRDLGGGLVVVGGPESYGMGGYFETPLEAALPVNMQIKDQERFPSVSMALVIDRSGSMAEEEGGLTKIQLANEGAVRVVQLLNDNDQITIIPVDTVPDNPIGPISASEKETAINLIRQIGAGGGGIYVRTGLEAAALALAQSPHPIKHIILLADGADAEEKEGVPQLIEALAAEGVTVSTVSIGRGPDTPWLQQMAELGNGRFHFTDQAANLPQIFTQETTAIQRSYLIEERFFPILGTQSPILSGIRAAPPLYGYVGTSPKDTAQTILTTHQGDPLLAAWQYGLGRSVAWTSDATGRWATDWVRWEGFPTFWAQAVRWTIAEGRDNVVETAVTFDKTEARLTVDARDGAGQFRNDLDLEANVVDPAGVVTTFTLQQVAPGRYETTFSPRQEGAYLLRVAGNEANGDSAVGQTAGWVLGYSPEYRDLRANPQQLNALAAATNGRDLSSLPPDEAGAAIFAHDLASQSTARPIWPWLLLAALILLPVDIGVRRLVITRTDLERAWAASAGRLLPKRAPAQARTEQTARLFEAKQRASKPRQTQPVDPVINREGETAVAGETAQPTSTDIKPDKVEPSVSGTEIIADQPPEESGSLAARLRQKREQQRGQQ